MYALEEGNLDNNNFIKLVRVTITLYLLAHNKLNSFFFMFVGGVMGYSVSESAFDLN